MHASNTRDRRRKFAIALSLLALTAFMAGLPRRAAAAPPRVGDRAADFELTAIDQSKGKLSDLLKRGPVVLIVLRGYPGYQCPFCTRQVGELIGKGEQLAAAKCRVLLVYPGPSAGLKQHASEFIEGKMLPKNFTLALDPDYSFTKKYDLRWDAPQETAYPSTFVIDSSRKILFAKISHTHGERAQIDDILKALAK